MKRLIDWSVEHPISVGIIFFALVFTSLYSISRLKLELFPDISLPTITIISAYPGASVIDVEENITKPLENALRAVRGIREISSRSIEEYSQITVYFNAGVDISKAYIEVVDKVRGVELPNGALKPSIIPFDPSVFPVMTVAFPEDQYELVKTLWVNRVLSIVGISLVPTLRTYEEYISVNVFPEKLAIFGIRPSTIFGLIGERAYSFPLGKSSVISGKLDLSGIKDIIIGKRGDRPVFLYEVADIKNYRENYEVLQLNNGIPVIISPVFKSSDANTYEVSRKLKEVLEEIKRDGRLNFWVAMDQGFLIEKVVKEVINTAIFGGILAVIIILLFTRSFRLSAVISLSIPISLGLTFISIDLFGYKLNAMTLAGIALAIGMIIDNSVVVSENIYRYITEGYNPKEASKEATYEVLRPIFSSTITNIIVFVPVIYLYGAIGEIARNVGISFVSALLSTLLVSTAITPAYAHYILAKSKRVEFKLANIYRKVLSFMIKRKLQFPLAFVLLSPLALIPFVGGEFVPILDSDFIFLDIELPSNTPFEKTSLYMKNVSRLLSKIPEIENYAVFVSTPKDVPKGIIAYGGGITETYKGQAFIRLKERAKRKRAQWEIEETIRNNLPKFPGLKVRFLPVERITLFGMKGKSVSITFLGQDRETLKKLANRFAEDLKRVKGLTNVVVEIPPEMDILLFRPKEMVKITGLPISEVQKDLALLKLSPKAVEIENTTVKLKYDGDVSVLPLVGQRTRAYFVDFVEVETLKTPSIITRLNGLPSITVSADRTTPNLLSVSLQIQKILLSYKLPRGYTYVLSGEMYELFDMLKQLTLAGILAVVLILAVIVLQFESFKEPLFISLSTIFSLAGSTLFIYAFGITFSIVSLLGVLISFGVVVNNGIVMLELAKKTGILKAAEIRLRPILITNLTTIFGLLPLIFVKTEGFEYRQPIAVALLGGMIFGLIYSLLILPLIYKRP
ncbi:MAG: efflux RND transporter permease subunit [candidate division WOR-3 bacterium]